MAQLISFWIWESQPHRTPFADFDITYSSLLESLFDTYISVLVLGFACDPVLWVHVHYINGATVCGTKNAYYVLPLDSLSLSCTVMQSVQICVYINFHTCFQLLLPPLSSVFLIRNCVHFVSQRFRAGGRWLESAWSQSWLLPCRHVIRASDTDPSEMAIRECTGQ